MSGSRVLQLEQNNFGYAHDGLHCCISNTRNICDVSATYMMVARRMQRTCVAAALTTCVRHHDVNLTACVRHHATTHTCTHRHMPLLLHDPASDHSRSTLPPYFRHHSPTRLHTLLHDPASDHSRHILHISNYTALLASSPGLLQPPFLGRHAALAGIRLIRQRELAE